MKQLDPDTPDVVPAMAHGWVVVAPIGWRRGKAVRQGDAIRIEAPEEYTAGAPTLAGRGDLLSDLSAVGAAPLDDAARLVPEFVRRHGLLRHGPSAARHTEAWADVWSAGHRVDRLIGAHAALQGLAGATTRQVREMRRLAAPLLADYQFTGNSVLPGAAPEAPLMEDAATADRALPVRTALVLAAEANSGLESVGAGLMVHPGWQGDYTVRLAPHALALQARDLVGLAYAGLALIAVRGARVRRCKDPQCQRWFVPDEGRRRYCPTGCAERYWDRQRVKARRQRQKETTA